MQIVDFTNCCPWNNSNLLGRIYSFICTNVRIVVSPRHTVVDKYVHSKDDNQDICLLREPHHFKSGRAWNLLKVLGSFLIAPPHF